MAANELVRSSLIVLCSLISEFRNITGIKKTTVDTDVFGIQTPHRKECACLKQNNFGAHTWSRAGVTML